MSLIFILKESMAVLALSTILTYLSLYILPSNAVAICGDVGNGPIYCTVKAYGFPMAFLADDPSISPFGTVSRNPLWVLIGEDDLRLPELGFSFACWLAVAIMGHALWRRPGRERLRAVDDHPE